MLKFSKFGEEYLLLTLRVGKHIKDYVDFYVGPEKFQQVVNNNPLFLQKSY